MHASTMTDVEAPRQAPAKNMVWIPQGEFLMGSEQFYPEERPVRPLYLWIF